MKTKIIAPSFLSADIWRTGEQISSLEDCHCEFLHLDMMDGRFVPNISFGPDWVKKLRPRTKMTFDAHLMVEEADYLLPACAAAGCNFCSIHWEAQRHIDRSLRLIRDLGMRPGVALNPATPVPTMKNVLPLVDIVILMGVNPGFGGQRFISYTLDKLTELSELRQELGLDFLIEMDGGATVDNALAIAVAGADIIVAGNAVFGQPDVGAAFRAMHRAVNL